MLSLKIHPGSVCARALLLMASGCAQPLRPAECSKLMDRYTELLLGIYRPDITAEQRMKLRRETLRKAAKDPEFLRCPDKVSRRQFDCAMRAVSVDDMERCLI